MFSIDIVLGRNVYFFFLRYERESSGRGDLKAFSPMLQSLTTLCLSLVDKFKGQDGVAAPAWFETIYEFRALLALLKNGQVPLPCFLVFVWLHVWLVAWMVVRCGWVGWAGWVGWVRWVYLQIR